MEIKLLNLPADAYQKDQFKWLLINKETHSVKPLDFRSMDSSHAVEERFFDLGYLKFDAEKGIYISKEPPLQYVLENTNCQFASDSIMTIVSNYLNAI